MSQSKNISELKSEKHLWLFPAILLVICLACTVAFSFFVGTTLKETQKLKFDTQANQISESIQDRFTIYSNALYGGRGLFDASTYVDRSEWNKYVASLEIQKHYPGIQGIGFSLFIPRSELESHEEFIQEEGFSDYTVRPSGVRSEYTSIIYLEPFDVRNRQAFGFDMFQESVRRAAMSRARDTGEAALTERVTLVQEIDQDVQAGFLVYVPVYKNGAPKDTLAERQKALFGYVYSPFRMNDFMKGIVSGDLENIVVEIFNGDNNIVEEQRMFGKSSSYKSFVLTDTFTFAGNTWTIRYSAGSNFEVDVISKYTPHAVALAGTLLSFILFFLVYGIKTKQNQSLKMAKSMTQDLEERTIENEKIRIDLEATNKHLEESGADLTEKVAELEKVNKLMVGRELRIKELKDEVERLKGSK